jgi:hypothetical protein
MVLTGQRRFTKSTSSLSWVFGLSAVKPTDGDVLGTTYKYVFKKLQETTIDTNEEWLRIHRFVLSNKNVTRPNKLSASLPRWHLS